ncbi:PAS domain-containing protein [Nisaea sediminum]|uniref:PAS domain-containing protein n=1 Tax=Nisaea sediminum TaxID=2775867 RepID=UPI001867A869|nr:PAS domain-containing protein [Nisaea sediminum]
MIGEGTILESDRVRQIVAQWNDLRADRIGPRRCEVDPIDLFDFLPNLAMIKVMDGNDPFQFSLIGTGLAKIYGLVTRQFVSSAVFPGPTKEVLQQALELCATARAPVHGIWRRVKTVNDVKVDIEVVLLPISEDGAEVSRILCYHVIAL